MARKHDKKKESGNGKSAVQENVEEELFNEEEENLVEESFDEDDY